MIFFVTFLVVGVEIAIASLTHKTLLDSISILIVVPRRMMKIFGLTPIIFMTPPIDSGNSEHFQMAIFVRPRPISIGLYVTSVKDEKESSCTTGTGIVAVKRLRGEPGHTRDTHSLSVLPPSKLSVNLAARSVSHRCHYLFLYLG